MSSQDQNTSLLALFACALDFPGELQRQELQELWKHLDINVDFSNSALSNAQLLHDDTTSALETLLTAELMDLQAQATQFFDLSRSTSLRLFEHVHGDSRARGQAMAELLDFYSAQGLQFCANELPDHLCVILEACSLIPAEKATELLGNFQPVLESIYVAHSKQSSPWTGILRGVLSLTGLSAEEMAELQHREASPELSDAEIDTLWEEPEAFGVDQNSQAWAQAELAESNFFPQDPKRTGSHQSLESILACKPKSCQPQFHTTTPQSRTLSEFIQGGQ